MENTSIARVSGGGGQYFKHLNRHRARDTGSRMLQSLKLVCILAEID